MIGSRNDFSELLKSKLSEVCHAVKFGPDLHFRVKKIVSPDQIEPNSHQPNTSSSKGADCGHSAKKTSLSSRIPGNPRENSLLTKTEIKGKAAVENMSHGP